MRGMSDMVWPNYFKILTALTLTAAAVLLGALLIAAAPASAQEEGSSFVGGTDPSDQQTGVHRDTNVTVYFGWDVYVDQSTVNANTFTLVKQGTTTPVAASIIYYPYCEGENWSGLPCYAVLDPQQELEANTSYTATLKGGENGVKGTSLYGDQITMPADYSWSFTTGDSAAPPETTITSAPCGPKSGYGGVGNISGGPCEPTTGSASIAFTSSKADSIFECSLDGAAFTSCTSPQDYWGLSDGTHTFQVRATDASGNTDPTPAYTSWTVQAPADATAPTISITSPADGATYQQGASIYASYSCSDSADSSPQCTGTVPNGSAIDTGTTGTKTFTVTAKDSAGNTNQKSVTYYVTKNGKARGNR
jgi:hypothetical protein